MIWLILYNLTLPFLFCSFLTVAFVNRRVRAWLLLNLRWEAMAQRLGLQGGNPKAFLWIHAASVGELRCLVRLLTLAHKERPDFLIHLTCQTQSGLDFARESLMSKGLVASAGLAPLDIWPCIARYVNRMKSLKLMVFVETELWPNWITHLKRKEIPLLWVNARMSSKTKRWISVLRGLAKRLFLSFHRIVYASQNTHQLLLDFGCHPDRLIAAPNLKWDFELPESAMNGMNSMNLLTNWGWDEGSFVWTAGSTREGEEEILIDIFARLAPDHPQFKLILAPRHLERVGAVKKLLERKNLSFGLYSEFKGEGQKRAVTSVKGPSVLLVDRFGVLLECYSISSVVFVGGSLVFGVGGHNFLEPAALSKPVVVGPYLENFQEIADFFKEREAFLVVQNLEDLSRCLAKLMADSSLRQSLGRRSAAIFQSVRGASQQTWEIIRSAVVS